MNTFYSGSDLWLLGQYFGFECFSSLSFVIFYFVCVFLISVPIVGQTTQCPHRLLIDLLLKVKYGIAHNKNKHD